MADRVLVEILVAAPIETVRRTICEPAEVARWFGWDYPNMLPDIEMMWKDNTLDSTGRVLSSEGMPDRLTLEPAGNQTIVRVIRSAPAENAGWQGIYDDMVEGWLTFMQQLKFALERHAGADRRTLFLNGRAKGPGTPHPVDALGLSPLWVVAVDERYRTTTAAGDVLEGTVYFRSSYQLGLTVDGFGDGLLICTVRPRTGKSQHGGGTILITTYGMDDAAFLSLRDRWSRWWSGVYEVIDIQPASA